MKYFSFIFVVFFAVSGFGQSSYIHRDLNAAHTIDRIDIKGLGNENFHTGLKYYSRTEIADFISNAEILSEHDKFRIQKLNSLIGVQDSKSEQNISYNEPNKVYVDSAGIFYTLDSGSEYEESKPIEKSSAFLKYFYKRPGRFFEINSPDFHISVDPILNLRYGQDSESEDLLFQNTRGIRLFGSIDDKVYFYTDLLESQGSFLAHVEERIQRFQAIPGHSSYKLFQSSVADDVNGYDFPLSTAYVGLNVSKSISVELGHGRHFIGHGYNSLLLDDYGTNYFYLKFRTKVWKLLYQNIFAELSPVSQFENPGDNLLDKKYMASHYLSFKPKENIEIGLFETVMFSRENNFEFQYLNPVILYRTVEFNLDSPDNVLIGLNAKWNAFKKFSFYGQVILDEFKLNEIRDGSGWWANKYGFQAGIKYMDVAGIDQLDGQIEYNYVRPFTYTHRDTLEGFNTSVSNYSHFNQTLAHPLGANFKELILSLNYKATNRLNLNGRAMMAQYGEDDGQNWGGNVLLPNESRVMDFGNSVGQGILMDVLQLSLEMSYEIYDNMFIDLDFIYRNRDSELDDLDLKTQYIGLGFRANINRLKLDY